MPGSRPQRLLLRDAPAAVLLLELPADGGDAAVAAADDAAAHLAGAASPAQVPAGLTAFWRAAGLAARQN
ncbi:hypothetical protein, partial [Kineococcus indalonis]|uniref:hypothetical protein n=1 Tax=Kineococcus indalonis TaxID=2696566 RepID=UPI00141336EE